MEVLGWLEVVRRFLERSWMVRRCWQALERFSGGIEKHHVGIPQLTL